MTAVWPSLLLVLGAALGTATQMSENGTMVLRIPALFAALFMVAQGLFELESMRRGKAAVSREPGGDGVPGRAAYQSPPSPPGGAAAQARMLIPVVLMGLGGWLGLAVLRGAGGNDVPLEVLATLSAFLLFAIGWQVLLGAR